MDPMAVSGTPTFPKGDELQDIIVHANRLRAEESGRILRRWLGLDRRPRDAAPRDGAAPTTETPVAHEG